MKNRNYWKLTTIIFIIVFVLIGLSFAFLYTYNSGLSKGYNSGFNQGQSDIVIKINQQKIIPDIIQQGNQTSVKWRNIEEICKNE